jgi:hypothetical protein
MHDAFSRKRWPALEATEPTDVPRPGSILQEIGIQLALCLAIALLACVVFGVP